ncbi:MAG: TraR/DksA C4-type zinc finger protein [Patescibacteria group bacterium]
MDKKTIKEYKAILVEEQAALKHQLADVQRTAMGDQEKSSAMFPDYGNKDDENAAEVATFADNISIEADLKNNLKNVEHALQHIEDDEFGICELCGKDINLERLKIYPSATLCVICSAKK